MPDKPSLSALAEQTSSQVMTSSNPFSVRCTLTFGDIYGQVLAWMAVIFVSLAAGLALMGSSRPLFALVGVGLILVLSLPFLLFAFVTTLINHIQVEPTQEPASQAD
ncbi:hypothetical protein KR100_08115 [Synechococcus sp. KORDI-100]|nr:hypothetical protein KR100_08115 [Synechococcus sp. KORDI-100]